ncbi:MAG: hypothetical protein Q9194_002314 [Teloschistes cf. exilis]
MGIRTVHPLARRDLTAKRIISGSPTTSNVSLNAIKLPFLGDPVPPPWFRLDPVYWEPQIYQYDVRELWLGMVAEAVHLAQNPENEPVTTVEVFHLVICKAAIHLFGRDSMLTHNTLVWTLWEFGRQMALLYPFPQRIPFFDGLIKTFAGTSTINFWDSNSPPGDTFTAFLKAQVFFSEHDADRADVSILAFGTNRRVRIAVHRDAAGPGGNGLKWRHAWMAVRTVWTELMIGYSYDAKGYVDPIRLESLSFTLRYKNVIVGWGSLSLQENDENLHVDSGVGGNSIWAHKELSLRND